MKKKQFWSEGNLKIGLYKNEVVPNFTFTIENSDTPTKEYTFDPEFIVNNYEIKDWEYNGKILKKYEINKTDLIEVRIKEREDAHLNEMTIRDFYCIINKVAISNKPCLNDLINGT